VKLLFLTTYFVVLLEMLLLLASMKTLSMVWLKMTAQQIRTTAVEITIVFVLKIRIAVSV
jgi:hypothetical protein